MSGIEPFFVSVALLLLFTCFVKIFTTLSILRTGFGLVNNGFGLVVFALSLGVSSFVMAPYIGINDISGDGVTRASLEQKTKPFMEQNSDPRIIEKLKNLDSKRGIEHKESDPIPTYILAPAFVISELRDAFEAGLILIIPFLVVDLLVANALLLLGNTSLSASVISLPLKLLLFLAANGWELVGEKLISGYL